MSRLRATLLADATLQLRNGFYAATAFVGAVWAAILLQAPPFDWRWLLPPLAVGNLLLSTFYFMGALVLLEKDEGTLTALVVTPLRIGEYLLSKVATLTALALAETLLIVALATGGRFDLPPLLLGTALAAALYCLAGFVAVARYDSINTFLLPSGAYVALLWLPLPAYMAQWRHWSLYLHPLMAPMVLVEGAFRPLATWEALYGVGAAAVWLALFFVAGRRAFRRWLVAR
jgi:fluoroquinolone transport system permease protein